MTIGTMLFMSKAPSLNREIYSSELVKGQDTMYKADL
jgi:hypothetical protein